MFYSYFNNSILTAGPGNITPGQDQAEALRSTFATLTYLARCGMGVLLDCEDWWSCSPVRLPTIERS